MHEEGNMGMHGGEGMGVAETPKRRGSWKMWLCWVVVLVVVAGGVACWVWKYEALPLFFYAPFHQNYQSVFLSNGQVYFGKLYREEGRYPVLKDIYYLQVTQPPQPLQEGQVPPTNINLVKLGGELHGPTDEMRINRDQILFIEDLSEGSRVLDAIVQYKAGAQ